MGLLGLKVCSSSIFDCFFSKQKFDGIGFLVAVCVPCYWQPHLLFRQSFITPACWRPSPPTPLTTGVTLTPTGITCELKDVDTTGCPVHRRGTSAGPQLCSCAQAPIRVQAYFFLWHWEHGAKSPRTESGASSPAAGRWECWLMDYREAKKVKSLSLFRLFATPRTVAHEAPLSMGFSRQEYWSGFPFPSSGDLPDPGVEPRSPVLQADTLPTEPPGKPICMLKGSSFLILQRGELAQREKISTETVQLRPSWNPSILTGKIKALSEVEGIWRLIHLPHFLQMTEKVWKC